jgi:F0F1-type ATP synthase assembly protein I
MVPFNRPIPDSKRQNKASSSVKSLADAGKLTQIATLLPCSVFVGWLAGAWLDSHFHQAWLPLVGILLGGFSGLVYVVRLVMAGASQSTPSAVDQSGSDGTGGKL